MRFAMLLLFLAFPASAAPPVLTVAPANPKPGDSVLVTAPAAATFEVRGSAEVTRHGAKAVVFTLPASGSVVVVASAGKTASPADTAVVIVGGGNVNPTPPGPGPTPPSPPDPVPVTPTKLSIYYIEESADQVAGRGALFANADLAKRVKDKGHKWRVADVDVKGTDGKPPADLVKYLDLAKGKTIPQVFLVDADGAIRYQGDAPAKAVDLIALLEKYGG